MNIGCETWFERDRAMVAVVDKDADKDLIEWWDDDVHTLVELGLLDPHNIEQSAIQYAKDIGVIPVDC